jgi:hypothetical protein
MLLHVSVQVVMTQALVRCIQSLGKIENIRLVVLLLMCLQIVTILYSTRNN